MVQKKKKIFLPLLQEVAAVDRVGHRRLARRVQQRVEGARRHQAARVVLILNQTGVELTASRGDPLTTAAAAAAARIKMIQAVVP